MTNETPDAKVRADIKKHGWHCLNVWPMVGEDRTAFSYTIGLAESYGHPEIAVFGLGDKAHGILRDCANLVSTGTRFVEDQPNNDVLSGDYKVIFKSVRKDRFNEYFGTALRYYGSQPFDAFVLFWPNKQHEFPWEAPEPGMQAEALHVV